MNNYFSNLTANLTNKENTERLLNNIPGENYDQSFHLNNNNYNEVYKMITNIKSDCSSCHDNIPVRYLKPVAEYITSLMVHIINTSIDQEIFPKQWKISRVCPIPKTDNPTSIKDYWPISVLSVLSKVYQLVILNQLCRFIETQILYSINQSGFLKDIRPTRYYSNWEMKLELQWREVNCIISTYRLLESIRYNRPSYITRKTPEYELCKKYY